MNIQQLRAQIAALQDATMDENRNFLSGYHEGKFDALSAVDALLDSLQEEPVSKQNLSNSFNIGKDCKDEPVSEELEEAAYHNCIDRLSKESIEDFKAGAKWQKEKEYTCYEEAFEDGAKWKVENLWKPAYGDDLPEIDREVIAILYNGKVVFAHRPPEFWDGKNIITGKVTRNYPKTYDKGGWNIPDVKWWLDCSMPKEIEL